MSPRALAAALALAASGAAAQPVPQTAYAPARLDATLAPEAPAARGLAPAASGTAASGAGTAASGADPLPDEWVARDKAMHLGASFLLTLSGQYVLTDKAGLSDGRALPVAAGSALALGLLKEVADAPARGRPPLLLARPGRRRHWRGAGGGRRQLVAGGP